jgi:YHS domain-containing protein
MAIVKDPVCGMTIDSETAVARAVFEGREYLFCSTRCRDSFIAAPERYVREAPVNLTSSDLADKPLEQHEPPFTKSGGITAPKFGAAGSGGLEYERLPEAHDDKAEP